MDRIWKEWPLVKVNNVFHTSKQEVLLVLFLRTCVTLRNIISIDSHLFKWELNLYLCIYWALQYMFQDLQCMCMSFNKRIYLQTLRSVGLYFALLLQNPTRNVLITTTISKAIGWDGVRQRNTTTTILQYHSSYNTVPRLVFSLQFTDWKINDISSPFDLQEQSGISICFQQRSRESKVWVCNSLIRNLSYEACSPSLG